MVRGDLFRMKRTRKQKREVEEQVQQLNDKDIYELTSLPISSSLEENKKILDQLFKDSSDIVIREFTFHDGKPAIAIFVDGLIHTQGINDVLKSIMVFKGEGTNIEVLKRAVIPSAQIAHVDNYADFLQPVLSGDTGIFIEGVGSALLLGIRGPQLRSVGEPESESVIRGPREGFIESLRTNTALIRRRLKTPRLKIKPLMLGKESNTNIALAYIEGIVDPETLKEVQQRLQKIEIDAILETGYIEELIEDSTFSPFPQVQYSERPDTVAAALLEGRIAIMVDGTPIVLIVPTTFWTMMQANEDYYERFQIATLIRWLRYFSLALSLLTPAMYVAVTTYHQAMLPTTLLLSVAAARETIPFPAVVETLIMEVSFEALREAGVRLPKTVGQAVSILGALVVGQAAVQAGIVSAPMVIVVSITGIASFTIPRYNSAITFRMLRFPLIIAASLFGIYGIMLGIILILGHMANLRSFGVPYLSPISPFSTKDIKDVAFRMPWPLMIKRPSFFSIGDEDRMGRELQRAVLEEGGQTGKYIEHDTNQREKDNE